MQKSIISRLFPMLALGMMYAAEPTVSATLLDLDALMDAEMDKVETLPDYVTPPEGAYMLSVVEAKIEPFDMKAKPAEGGQPARAAQKGNRIRITYKVEKTMETSDLPVRDGSLFSDSFMGTEDGLKFFKKQAMNILNVTDLSGARLKDILDGLKDVAFKAKITIRRSPDGKGGQYENVQVRPVHEAAA